MRFQRVAQPIAKKVPEKTFWKFLDNAQSKEMISSRTIVFQFLNITDVHDETRDIIHAIQHLIKYKSSMRSQTKKILKTVDSLIEEVPSLIEEMGCALFGKGITNEGILEMFYFCNKLASKFKVSRRENYLPFLAECLSRYFIIWTDDWLMSNGGWDNFIQLSTEKSNTCLSFFCELNCV